MAGIFGDSFEDRLMENQLINQEVEEVTQYYEYSLQGNVDDLEEFNEALIDLGNQFSLGFEKDYFEFFIADDLLQVEFFLETENSLAFEKEFDALVKKFNIKVTLWLN